MPAERASQDALTELPPAYRKWRASRLGRITDALEEALLLDLAGPVAGLCVLDIGCGDGQLALALAEGGADVSVADADARMLEAASRRFDRAALNVHLYRAKVQALPFEPGSFDVVTAVTVLCFVREPERALVEMSRILKPGGSLIIGELSSHSTWAVWRRIRGWFGHRTWRAARFRTAAQLRNLAALAGLQVQTVRAAVFYPPVGLAAALLAPLDRWLGGQIVFGGAFLALRAIKPVDGPERNSTTTD